jgi:hypothetical protein
MAGDIHETTGRGGDKVRLDPFQNIKSIHWPSKGRLLTIVTTFLHEYDYFPWGGNEKLEWYSELAGDFEPWVFDTPTPSQVGLSLDYVAPVPGGTSDLRIHLPKNWLTLSNGVLPTGMPDFAGRFCGVFFTSTTGYQSTSNIEFINIGRFLKKDGPALQWEIGRRFGRADENSWIFNIQIATWDGTTDWRYAGYGHGLASLNADKPVKSEYRYQKPTEGGLADKFLIRVDANLALNVTHSIAH